MLLQLLVMKAVQTETPPHVEQQIDCFMDKIWAVSSVQSEQAKQSGWLPA